MEVEVERAGEERAEYIISTRLQVQLQLTLPTLSVNPFPGRQIGKQTDEELRHVRDLIRRTNVI